MLSSTLLALFVIDLGIVFGAGIYEARISVPRWLGLPNVDGVRWHPEEAKRDDVGRRFWAMTTTVPLTLLTIGNLWSAWQSSGASRSAWLVASVAALTDRVLTFSYFIPRMVVLLRSDDGPEARARAKEWAKLNYLRLLFVSIAWLAALVAFARLHQAAL
jgi:hypothetical protein